MPEVYSCSASAKTGKRSLNFVLRCAAKGQMHNKGRCIERGVRKEQIRSKQGVVYSLVGAPFARTNTNNLICLTLPGSSGVSFPVSLHSSQSRVESSAMSSWHILAPIHHPTPIAQLAAPFLLENLARSQLVSQLQFTSISLRLLRFSLHTFWGGK